MTLSLRGRPGVKRGRHRAPTPGVPSDHRADIQGLRAVAVGLVVIYHLWPKGLSGGYVGVDVFFVISGYLITAHIHREVAATGTLRVTRFWARRIRRLLPASLLVLALSGLGVLAFAPSTTWDQSAREIAASALYVQNWQLASSAVDYMAADNAATVAQHFWSLSVEEQFYAVWPLLILAILALAGRLPGRLTGRVLGRARRGDARTVMLVGLGVLGVASLWWSVVSTAQDQAFAYLSSLTRVWEFALGGIAGLAGVVLKGPAARVASAVGLIAIVGSAGALTESSAFPGWVAAVPVVGAVAVLLGESDAPAARLLATRPMTFLGDVSYSIYLVHWPLIVLVPFVTGAALGWPQKALILLATVVLAWLSKTYVEDPLRTGGLLTGPSQRTFAFAALGMALVVGGCSIWGMTLERQQERAAAASAKRLTSAERCLGPQALVSSNSCDPVAGTAPLVSPPETVVAQNKDALFARCQQNLAGSELLNCTVGDPKGSEGTVALVGDSHASAFIPTLDQLGKDRKWKVIVHTKSSCPSTDARRTVPGESSGARQRSCSDYNKAVDTKIMADRSITQVFATSYTRAYGWEGAGGAGQESAGGAEVAREGFTGRWQRWIDAGKDVTVITDVPATIGESVPNCIAQNAAEPQRCSTRRADAVVPDLAVAAAKEIRAPVIDLTDLFCDASRCFSQVGSTIVYRDRSHLSIEYARMLAPFVDSRLRDGEARSAG